MVRLCTGDWYPFQNGIRFGIEAGGNNDQYLEHSGVIFYYGVDEIGMSLTDTLDVGDPDSERVHNYKVAGQTFEGSLESYYEGDDDHILVKDHGRAFGGYSEFTVRINPENSGVRLRRRSDQCRGRQKANVYVDGVLVKERTWYFADKNPYKRWLEDEFQIPAFYTRGKEKLKIKIEPVEVGGVKSWNEYFYWVYSIHE